MTEIMERMRKVLRDTGLYSGEGKIMAAELAAYGAGLSILFDAIDALRHNMFIGTADAAGLAAFERLFRITPSTDSVENRRAMLLERGGVTAADHTRDPRQHRRAVRGRDLRQRARGARHFRNGCGGGGGGLSAGAPALHAGFRAEHVGRGGRARHDVRADGPQEQDMG